jgi:hypothetical protein
MSEIERRVRNGKRRWVARYSDPDGTRRAKTFDRKIDAQNYLSQIVTSKLHGNMWIQHAARSRLLGWLTSGWRHKAT